LPANALRSVVADFAPDAAAASSGQYLLNSARVTIVEVLHAPYVLRKKDSPARREDSQGQA
jgi:hypothetical protein